MKFGKNTQLVEEAITLFKNLKFSESPSLDSTKFLVVDKFEDALNLAWEKTYGPNELTWPDIKSEKMSEVWDAAYQLPDFNKFDGVLSQEFDSMSRVIDELLFGSISEALDEIVADFQGCLYSRFVFARGNEFYESLFEAYSSRVWPCGWHGDYPAGKVVVYVPASKANSRT